jgi:hypothetical protein
MGRAKPRSRSTCPGSEDSRRRSGQSSLTNRAPRGGPGHRATCLVCPRPDSATWAGSPAGSSRTGPGPNAPSCWPSGSAASTPPLLSWAPPGRRCVKPFIGTASACPPATPRPSGGGRRGCSPAHPAASHSRPGPGVCGPQPGRPPRPERPAAELFEWVRRDEQYATLGANVVVELYSESHARQPTTRAWAIIRRADRSHRLAGQRASRSDRRHGDRTGRSQQSQEREIAADAR